VAGRLLNCPSLLCKQSGTLEPSNDSDRNAPVGFIDAARCTQRFKIRLVEISFFDRLIWTALGENKQVNTGHRDQSRLARTTENSPARSAGYTFLARPVPLGRLKLILSRSDRGSSWEFAPEGRSLFTQPHLAIGPADQHKKMPC
jgi:hypothetical protein